MTTQAPRTGSSKTITFEVQKSHTITFTHEVEISVLSTPSLIWFLEQAALQFLEPWLDDKSLSVGTHVNCTARLIYQDGPVYRFSVEAHAGQEKIAKGLHSRRIIKASQLIKRLQAP